MKPAEAPLYETILPNLSLLTTVRSPYKTIDSHLAHTLSGPASSDIAGAYDAVLVAFSMSALRKDLGCLQNAVRFEDLHRQTEKTMRALCDLYGITFSPILLETTLDGEEYRFPTNGRFVTGVNPEMLDDDGKYAMLAASDLAHLEPFVERFCEKYGYRSKPLDSASIVTRNRSQSDPLVTQLSPEALEGLWKMRRAGPEDFPALVG
jgi:hypothetical protein